jgi:hypothetical protein
VPRQGGASEPIRLFAVISDDRSEKTNMVRVCHLHVRRLGIWNKAITQSYRFHGSDIFFSFTDILSSAVLTGEGTVRLAVRLRGQSTIMRAPPSIVPSSVEEGEHSIDVVFSVQYTHNFKVLSKGEGQLMVWG